MYSNVMSLMCSPIILSEDLLEWFKCVSLKTMLTFAFVKNLSTYSILAQPFEGPPKQALTPNFINSNSLEL